MPRPKHSMRRKPNKPSRLKAPMPSVVEPMLPTPVKLPFSDPNWLFEPKWEGMGSAQSASSRMARFDSFRGTNATLQDNFLSCSRFQSRSGRGPQLLTAKLWPLIDEANHHSTRFGIGISGAPLLSSLRPSSLQRRGRIAIPAARPERGSQEDSTQGRDRKNPLHRPTQTTSRGKASGYSRSLRV